jgi:outer membrane murein-binding lipoprotein Lpp
MRNLKFKYLYVVLAGLTVTGCSTPRSVRQLSDRTSANLATLSDQLKRLAEGHANIAQARAQTYAAETRAVSELRQKLDNLIAIRRISGQGDILTSFQVILNESDRQAAAHAALQKEQQDTFAEVTASLEKVSVPSKQLDELSKNLSSLTADESLTDRAKALYQFYSDVRNETEKRLKDQADSTKTLKSTARASDKNPLGESEELLKTLINH